MGEPSQGVEALGYFGYNSCTLSAEQLNSLIESYEVDEFSGPHDVKKPLLRIYKCRICQNEDNLQNMETLCACNGSLKYAHRKCIQRWCNEKGDKTCEFCHKVSLPSNTLTFGPVAPSPQDQHVHIVQYCPILSIHTRTHTHTSEIMNLTFPGVKCIFRRKSNIRCCFLVFV